MGVDNMSKLFWRTLMPYAYKRAEQIKSETASKATRLVHYTSADVLIKIAQNKEVWLRNSSVMNDYSEVEYGDQLLIDAWNGELGDKFKSILDKYHAGISTTIAQHHDGWAPTYLSETYLFSVSEHDQTDDAHGRLSMWREYARSDGVALVLSPKPFQSETQLLQAYTVPVMYVDEKGFAAHFEEVLEGLLRVEHHLREISPELITNAVFQAFRFLVVSTKHPAFKEEREWRIIYQPTVSSSPFIEKKIVSIAGVPQHVCALKLNVIANDGEELDLTPDSIIDRVLVGPTQNETVLTSSIIASLSDAGVSNASDLVYSAQIPLRL